MYISRETAQEIVEEIGGEIGAHINLMDEQGYIIASTDAARIGNLHEGARQIIRDHLPELYITKEMENAMTKKGINLPLVVEGNAVGVVGITGDREKVYGYGNIVRRMTEILIADSMQKDAKRYERRQRYYLLEEWLENPGISHSMDFQKRAAADPLFERTIPADLYSSLVWHRAYDSGGEKNFKKDKREIRKKSGGRI